MLNLPWWQLLCNCGLELADRNVHRRLVFDSSNDGLHELRVQRLRFGSRVRLFCLRNGQILHCWQRQLHDIMPVRAVHTKYHVCRVRRGQILEFNHGHRIHDLRFVLFGLLFAFGLFRVRRLPLGPVRFECRRF